MPPRPSDDGHGLEQDPQIAEQRTLLHVTDIERQPFRPTDRVAAIDLCQPGDAGFDLEPPVLVASVPVPVVHGQRSRADESDVAAQDVDQRGQFVEARRPQPRAQRGQPFCIELRRASAWFRMQHRAKLEHLEGTSTETQSTLSEQDSRTHPESYRDHGGAAMTGESSVRPAMAATTSSRPPNTICHPAHPAARRAIGRAGTPTTVVPGSTSLRTTAPAPTTAPSPIVTPGRMRAPTPIMAERADDDPTTHRHTRGDVRVVPDDTVVIDRGLGVDDRATADRRCCVHHGTGQHGRTRTDRGARRDHREPADRSRQVQVEPGAQVGDPTPTGVVPDRNEYGGESVGRADGDQVVSGAQHRNAEPLDIRTRRCSASRRRRGRIHRAVPPGTTAHARRRR